MEYDQTYSCYYFRQIGMTKRHIRDDKYQKNY